MTKVYGVWRRITMHSGECLLLPLALFDDEGAAQKLREDVDASTGALLPTALVAVGPGGKGQSTGLSFGGALSGLGIKGIATEVVPVDLQGKLVIPESPRIVLARN